MPLNVAWSGPGGFTSDSLQLHTLAAGVYALSITDANGCSMDSTITLTEPASAIDVSLAAAIQPSGTNVGCYGGFDGAIDATIAGGMAPYTFDWRGPDSTAFSTEDIAGLQAGLYELVVTDLYGCSYYTTIVLNQPDSALDATIALGSVGGYNTSCATSTDGSIDLGISGGSPSYTISWTGPSGFTSASEDLSGLAAGTYNLTVTDINGCVLNEVVVLTGPPSITATLNVPSFPGGTQISCAGVADGSIEAVITGGVPVYAIAWTGPGGFSSSALQITDLAAGTYCITITDQNNCTAQQCTDLVAPLPLQLSATTNSAGCSGINGSVDLTVGGGSGPYSYTWSNGANTEDLAGLVTGPYTVIVVDANGCGDFLVVTVDGSATIAGSGTVLDNACAGASDGAIDLGMLSGTAPFTYSWSNGANTEDLVDLSAGSYLVDVTDASGCTWTGSFTVGAPTAFVVDSMVLVQSNGFNISTYNGNNGVIALDVSGGTPPYTYDWSHGASTSTVTGLYAGTYSVIITDANGCEITLEFILDQPTDLVMPTGFSPNGDGSNDHFVVNGLDGYTTNHLVILNRWGNVVFERINYRNDWGGENLEGEPLPNGTYFVILEINGGGITLQQFLDLRR